MYELYGFFVVEILYWFIIIKVDELLTLIIKICFFCRETKTKMSGWARSENNDGPRRINYDMQLKRFEKETHAMLGHNIGAERVS